MADKNTDIIKSVPCTAIPGWLPEMSYKWFPPPTKLGSPGGAGQKNPH